MLDKFKSVFKSKKKERVIPISKVIKYMERDKEKVTKKQDRIIFEKYIELLKAIK